MPPPSATIHHISQISSYSFSDHKAGFHPLKWKSKVVAVRQQLSSSLFVSSLPKHRTQGVNAFFFNPNDEPILKEALKEPVAFMGGMFAGLLRLDLKEDPLKEWVGRTVEASGIAVAEDEIDAYGAKPEVEESPQQIEIE